MVSGFVETVFSKSKYENYTGKLFPSVKDAISDYLINDAARSEVFSDLFDEQFYLSVYKDVQDAGIPPFLHYVTWGAKDGRVFSQKNKEELVKKLKKIKYFNPFLYKNNQSEFWGDVFEHAVLYGGDVGLDERVDVGFVEKYMPYTLDECQRAFEVFDRRGTKSSLEELDERIINIIDTSELFDHNYYISNYLSSMEFYKTASRRDAVIHYCCEGFRLLFSASPMFSTRAYLYSYSDIVDAGLNPLYHYITSGKAEGRVIAGLGTIGDGAQKLVPGRDWVLVVSHEASRTGAPIVGLELCKELSKKYNVVAWVGRAGDLTPYFIENSVSYLEQDLSVNSHDITVEHLCEKYSPKFVICNSAETYPALYACVEYGMKTVSLIHEFSEYARPRGRIAAMSLLSDKVLAPAKIIEKSIYSDLEYLGLEADCLDVLVQHQGVVSPDVKGSPIKSEIQSALKKLMLDRGKTKLVLGCGWVQPRKGVTKFLEVARRVSELRADVLFLWVGANFDPDSDASHSAYLQDYIIRSNIAEHVEFIDQLNSLSPVWEMADVFFMSSLLDPFPNVALDALVRNVPVVCFEKATGIAELREHYPDLVRTAKYLDDFDAAEAVIDLINSVKPVHSKEWWEERFSYRSYANFISKALDDVNSVRSDINNLPRWYLRKLRADYAFDPKERGIIYSKLASKLEKFKTEEYLALDHAGALRTDFSPIVIVDYHGGPSEFTLLIKFIHQVREKIPKVKIIIKTNILDKIYGFLSGYELLVGYEMVDGQAEDEKIILDVVSRKQQWEYEFLFLSFDPDVMNEMIDKVQNIGGTAKEAFPDKKIKFEFGLGGCKFKSRVRHGYYSIFLNYYSAGAVNRILTEEGII